MHWYFDIIRVDIEFFYGLFTVNEFIALFVILPSIFLWLHDV